ncbi:protein Mis18-alpha [Erpetoichthys calabaricus]|uniref:Protein yippee-like n=1 Tax=Erpetoichthys calabaricus TaxID=27687 RepID=A0A8C4TK83_ERPCA|nr:protein Mis18-alpha [Erpetoichthys calabaricus]
MSENEFPSLFCCGRCRVVLGDSIAWIGNDQEEIAFVFSGVSHNVHVKGKKLISGIAETNGCIFFPLVCDGCFSTVGKVYRATPKHLDYKKNVFFLFANAVTSYKLGSTNENVSEFEIEDTVTLEHVSYLMMEIKKMKEVLLVMESRLSALESEFNFCEN